jgi:hypothetical protein
MLYTTNDVDFIMDKYNWESEFPVSFSVLHQISKQEVYLAI